MTTFSAALTGYIFFYNNVTLMRLFFATPQAR